MSTKVYLIPFSKTDHKSKNGFTLIELSIVLVIIGLIVGGILAGKALIQQAEIRAAASQLQKFETAYRTFQVKYNCIMGDCPNATDFFGMNYVSIAAGCPPAGGAGNGNGDGNGLIDSNFGTLVASTWNCEPAQAVASLNLAGLLPDSLKTPCNSGIVYFRGINDSCAYFYVDDLYLTVTPIKINSVTWAKFSAGGNLHSAALSPVQARLIDEKIDDGKSTTGKFRGLNTSLPSGGAIVANSCVTSGAYNLNEDYTCRSLYYFK